MAMREKKRPKKAKVVELEAELYGTIATLDSISEKFDEGDLQPSLYKRQFKSLVSDTIKARQLLEAEGESWDEFVEEEKITERFPTAVEKLQIGERVPEGEEKETLAPQTSARMAAKTADIVSDLITLIDIAKLGDVAKMSLIIPLLDDAVILLTKYPNFPPDLFIGGTRKQRVIVRPKGTQHRQANTANARDKILILGAAAYLVVFIFKTLYFADEVL